MLKEQVQVREVLVWYEDRVKTMLTGSLHLSVESSVRLAIMEFEERNPNKRCTHFMNADNQVIEIVPGVFCIMHQRPIELEEIATELGLTLGRWLGSGIHMAQQPYKQAPKPGDYAWDGDWGYIVRTESGWYPWDYNQRKV